MDKRDEDEIRGFWNRIADDWNIQVGLEGDSNRILNSDPVLWAFAGNVRGRKVLDAGCGTGFCLNTPAIGAPWLRELIFLTA
jgi:ubiquinone/menaquinone biosynthesis C-methylase UbiE